MIRKGIRYLNGIRKEISLIRKNQQRDYRVKQFEALLSDPKVSEYFAEIRQLMTVKDVVGGGYCRIGSQDYSGGYIMLDDFKDKEIFYSFGISSDVSWDSYPAEILNKKVYMYDHTIDALPYEHNNFIWKKTGICGENEIGKVDNLKSLSEILKENGHENENNMILKMDVEGAEWDVFSTFSVDDLNRFDQIMLELHWFLDLKNKDQILKTLNNLNKNHQLIHVHGNSVGISIPMNGYNMPEIIEATWVKKEGREFKHSERFFPTVLDTPSDLDYPEIIMGYWN